MNDNVETTENTEAAEAAAAAAAAKQAELDAAVAAAQAAVDAAEAEVKTAQEAVKTQTESGKEARKSLKEATAYVKTLGERTEENASAYDTGVETRTAWEQHVEGLKPALDAAREAVKEKKEALKTAKAALREATKAAKPKAARRTGGGGTRRTLNPGDMITPKALPEGASAPKGMMADVVAAFEGGKTVSDGMAALKTAIEAKGESITSAQRWSDLDAFAMGYVKGAIRFDLIEVTAKAEPTPAEEPAAA